jgi:hypothetical protein
MSAEAELTTLITLEKNVSSSVKFAISELVLIYIHEKETKDPQRQVYIPSLTAICQLLVFVSYWMVLFLFFSELVLVRM